MPGRHLLARRAKYTRYTGGNFNFTSTTWAQLSASVSDLAIQAQTGDVLLATLNGHTGTLAQAQYLDVATIVSSAIVNQFGAGGASGQGMWWNAGVTTAYISAACPYTVVNGDVSNGVVTCRLVGRVSSAGTNVIQANSNEPLVFMVENIGLLDQT